MGYFYLFLKAFLNTFVALDYKGSSGKILVILVTIYLTSFLILRYQGVRYYNPGLNNFCISLEVF
jgi:hypothetical protein